MTRPKDPGRRYASLSVQRPPFQNAADEQVELATVIAYATHIITGVWPEASRVAVAVNALHDTNPPVAFTEGEET